MMEVLKIKKSLWEDPQNTGIRGVFPPPPPPAPKASHALLRLLPSVLDTIFRQSTFKCAAMALGF